MKRSLALAVLLVARVAHAEAPAAAVDVADLPPLPPASEEQSSSATVLAASSVEEDVVVGAAKREQSLGNVASAVTVVSGDRLRRFGYRTVGEALSAVAGVYLADSRISYSLGIRGLNIPGDFNTRILVLIDGASVNESWGSFAGLGFESLVSIDDIARIELIRGPVSSVYGANAFFGIVNIVTRGAAETPRAWGRVGINSINGPTTSAGFATGNVNEQVRGSVSFMNRFGDTNDLTAGDGSTIATGLSGDASRSYIASVVGAYHGTFAQVRAYHYYRDSPFAPYLADPTVDRPFRAWDSQLLVEGGHAREVSKRLTITGRGYANLYRYSDDIVQVAPMPRFLDIGDGFAFGAELRGRYELVVPNKVGITAGTEATYVMTESRAYEEGDEQCAPTGGAACVPQNFNIEGVYSEVDAQPYEWLGFTGGVRFDRNSVIDRRVSPRAALFLAKPEKYGAKLLYAEGFRNPSAFEAFFYDNTSFSQPQGLGAEKIRSFEAVVWAKPVGGLSTRLSSFYWSARDVVEQLPDPNNPMLLQFQNAAKFITMGVEAEASYRTTSGWYGFGGATYSRVGAAEDTTSEVAYGDVPNAPALVASFGVSTPLLFERAHFSTELTYISERPVRPDTDTGDPLDPAPQWLGVNATVYVPSYKGFDITAGVRNLIGKQVAVVAPGDVDRYDATTMTTITVPTIPGEGRELYVKVGYSY